jgi:mono/diheme cytochrome c family protein
MLPAWLALATCAQDADEGLPRAYRRINVPADVLVSPEAIGRAGELFRDHCAVCHGETGNGHGPRREGLVPPPRDFSSRAWRASTTPRRVFHAIREGLAPSAMPAWKVLSERQSWELTAYVLSMGDRR